KYFQFSCFQTKRPGAGNRQSPSVSRACCPNEGARVCDPQQRGMVRESANSRRTISQPRPFFLPFDLGNTPFIAGSTSQYPQVPEGTAETLRFETCIESPTHAIRPSSFAHLHPLAIQCNLFPIETPSRP